VDADFSFITEEYDRACYLSLPGAQDVHGWEKAIIFWNGLRSALPSAQFKIEHQIGYTAFSVRAVPYDGPSQGAMTAGVAMGHQPGAEINVMGVSHAEFGLRWLRQEITLFGDIAIWKQRYKANATGIDIDCTDGRNDT
jgi:hypothetical protein